MIILRFGALVVASFLGVVLAGCHSRSTDGSGKSEPEKVSLFQKGKGICLPDHLKKEFGVETVEVAEKILPRRQTKTARVYRAARGGQRAEASVLVTTEEAQELKPGQMAVFRRTPNDEAPFSGTLVRMDEHARPVLGQVEWLVEFADAARRFPVGAFLSASFITREAKPVFVVPETAVLRGADGCYVYAVNGAHLTRTPVKIGAVTDGLVEIEDGLYAGDAVVGTGVENLWLVELCALKGGTPCCPAPKKGTGK
jgi:multidrug efflux pump subunit AcrA (membrane-fusion protein)